MQIETTFVLTGAGSREGKMKDKIDDLPDSERISSNQVVQTVTFNLFLPF